jgi:hypothetical protein
MPRNLPLEPGCGRVCRHFYARGLHRIRRVADPALPAREASAEIALDHQVGCDPARTMVT